MLYAINICVRVFNQPTSTLDNMAPLAPLSSKAAAPSSNTDAFDDMFDELLDAPVPTKAKKGKSKKSKKSSRSAKKSSKKDDFIYGDTPLSPHLGDSTDDLDTFNAPTTFTAPSNIEEGDLDDSILGGGW